MTISTSNFGEIEINPADIINFEEGLPGFAKATRFVVLFQEPEGETPNPISFLQSVDDAELVFVLANMDDFYPDYAPMVHPFVEKDGFDVNSTAIYNIATVFEDMTQTTVNLKGPVLIDYDKKRGKQIVCQGDEFPIRAILFGATEEGEEA
ncbi:MAG: flagellar assembly protein FliW [Defluviitaleaceae bacterium]|nr:flagellar assembly protein FliW [Defluviitaleaceae bacterium]